MNATISVVCYQSKTLKNGEHPLMLRICKDNKKKYQSLGISVNPKYWDFVKNKPKPNCPNREQILKIILDKQAKLQSSILEYNAEDKSYTGATLLNAEKNKFQQKTVKAFYMELLEQYKNENKCGNRLIYKGSLNSLTLRSAYNKAIDAKCARRSDYPFDEYKINKFDTSTHKRAIAKTEVVKFMKDAPDLGKRHYVQLSKDIFIFSYLCGGINFTDIANLTTANIVNGRLEYVRQKTHKKIKIGIPSEAMKIIEKYTPESKGYLFPILDKNLHKTPLQKQNRIHKILAKVNKNLKLLAAELGIEDTVTTYVARHSFATILKKSGVNIAIISEALGHSDLATTQIYLDSFDNEQIDNAMKNLL